MFENTSNKITGVSKREFGEKTISETITQNDEKSTRTPVTEASNNVYHIRIIFLGSGHKAENYTDGSTPYPNEKEVHTCDYANVCLDPTSGKKGKAIIFSGPNSLDMSYKGRHVKKFFKHLQNKEYTVDKQTIKYIVRKAESILPNFIDTCFKSEDAKNAKLKINITGHSRGGIIARQIFEWLKTQSIYGVNPENITLNVFDEYGGPINSRAKKYGAKSSKSQKSNLAPPQSTNSSNPLVLENSIPMEQTIISGMQKNIMGKNSTGLPSRTTTNVNPDNQEPPTCWKQLKRTVKHKILCKRSGKFEPPSNSKHIVTDGNIKRHVISLQPEMPFTNITEYNNAKTIVITVSNHRGTVAVDLLFKLNVTKDMRNGLFFHTGVVTFQKNKGESVIKQVKSISNDISKTGQFIKIDSVQKLKQNIPAVVKAIGPNLVKNKVIERNHDILFGNGEKFKNIPGLSDEAQNLISRLRNKWKNDEDIKTAFCKLFANGAVGMRGVVILNAMGRFIKN